MKISDADILILPGLGNSGPGHWQHRWAERFSTGRIVEQDEWDNPDPRDWTAAIVEAVERAERPVVLVAHSLAVSALVHAAARLPAGKDPLPFPSLLVASNTDELVSPERAADMAAAWGSELHLAGDAGHINIASGHGPWPEGLLMFTRLMQRI